MADDIEAFLRRAAQRRKQQAARKASPAPRPKPEYTDSRSERQSRYAQPVEIIEAEVIEEPSLGSLGNRHLQSDHLADVVQLADDKLDSHIQQVFDHKVGRLESTSEPSTLDAIAEGDLALALIKTLQTPHGLQQAILLREIFERPEHRWD